MIKKEFVEERRTGISNYINQNKRADVFELAEAFHVTEVTIRRDLILLEQEGKLIRTHGGAMSFQDRAIWQTTNIMARLEWATPEKERIAKHVASLVKDGESLFIDGGSTTLLVARALLNHKRLLVVTNSPTIAHTLVGNNDNKVIITGGELEKDTDSILGASCEESIKQYRTDKAILGISGITIPDGLFAAIPQEASVKRLMASNAKYVILAADSSKIGTTAFAYVSDLNSPDSLVTDSKIDSEDLSALRKFKINIVTV